MFPSVALWRRAVVPELSERLFRLNPGLVQVLLLAEQLQLGLDKLAVVLDLNLSLPLVRDRGPDEDGDGQGEAGHLVVGGHVDENQSHQLHRPLDQVEGPGPGFIFVPSFGSVFKSTK